MGCVPWLSFSPHTRVFSGMLCLALMLGALEEDKMEEVVPVVTESYVDWRSLIRLEFTLVCVLNSALRFATEDDMALRQRAIQTLMAVLECTGSVEPAFVQTLVSVALDTLRKGIHFSVRRAGLVVVQGVSCSPTWWLFMQIPETNLRDSSGAATGASVEALLRSEGSKGLSCRVGVPICDDAASCVLMLSDDEVRVSMDGIKAVRMRSGVGRVGPMRACTHSTHFFVFVRSRLLRLWGRSKCVCLAVVWQCRSTYARLHLYVQAIASVDMALLVPHGPRIANAIVDLFKYPLPQVQDFIMDISEVLACVLLASADFGEEPQDGVEEWLQQSRDELTPERIAAAQRLFDAAMEDVDVVVRCVLLESYG